MIFTEPCSGCLKNLEHFPNKQKSAKIIPRTTNDSFQDKKKIKETFRGSRIENGKVKQFNVFYKSGKWTLYFSGAKNLCCNQMITTTSFTSQQTKWTFNVFFNLNCKSEYVIYLMEMILCKTQYHGKVETAFNLWLNNHRNDTKKPDLILAYKHCQQQGNFHKHVKIIIIHKLEKSRNSNKKRSDGFINSSENNAEWNVIIRLTKWREQQASSWINKRKD